MLTRKASDDNPGNFADIRNCLGKRLESVMTSTNTEKDHERLRLQEDINLTRQYFEVCRMAKETSQLIIHKFGEVIADGDSDQVLGTTWADRFEVEKALSKSNSAQLIYSMSEETLQQMIEKRYNSRFGAVKMDTEYARASDSPSLVFDSHNSTQHFPSRRRNDAQSHGPEARRTRPSPNEMRKRQADDGKE
jgi:hypothetical protein